MIKHNWIPGLSEHSGCNVREDFLSKHLLLQVSPSDSAYMKNKTKQQKQTNKIKLFTCSLNPLYLLSTNK